MKPILISLFLFSMMSCHFMSEENKDVCKITSAGYDQKIMLPQGLSCKFVGSDTICPLLLAKKYKIFTYVGAECTACQFDVMEWKQLIREADSLNYNVTFLFYVYSKDYEEFETHLEINNFSYPVFYDDQGECNKHNKVLEKMFYQTFLLDENNRVLLMGTPKPNTQLWDLYKRAMT